LGAVGYCFRRRQASLPVDSMAHAERQRQLF